MFETRLTIYSPQIRSECYKYYYLLTEAPLNNDVVLKALSPLFKKYSHDCVSVADKKVLESFKEYNQGEYQQVVECEFLPDVTDNEGNVAKELFSHAIPQAKILFVRSGVGQAFKKNQAITGEFFNQTIQRKFHYNLDELETNDRAYSGVESALNNNKLIHSYSLELDQLEKANQDNTWALSTKELELIVHHYTNKKKQVQRMGQGLPKEPTDIEMEVIAQTWSEHCKHKIFAAEIENIEDQLLPTERIGISKIDGLFKTFIKKKTAAIIEENQLDYCISLFSDNSGIVRYDSKLDICFKVETHNSPSALEPYGGALTGILGVNRDILGSGMGAWPLANTNVFCLPPPDYWDYLSAQDDFDEIPKQVLPPKDLLYGVHKGVKDGGNKSGIPVLNGSIFFEPSYTAKPLVYCGTLGYLPQTHPHFKNTQFKHTQVGDHIIVVGGAVGKDGIHGATFSSLALSETSPKGAVQIGDPLTQKRVTDFLQVAYNNGLYSGITDNGAGGLSSSVGEMATITNGAKIDLGYCPLKYAGLLPWEIMVSESQERMTLSVPEKNVSEILKLAKYFKILATDLGEFNDSGNLDIFYHDELVASLELSFIHDDLPPMQLKARWNPQFKEVVMPHWTQRNSNSQETSLYDKLITLLSNPNIQSKEQLVREYDMEVKGLSLGTPFEGTEGNGVRDSGVIQLHPLGGDKYNGVVIGHGLNPLLSDVDPKLMGAYSVDEAVRNCLASGGNPQYLALLDNFCWPNPVGENMSSAEIHRLGQLVRACVGMANVAENYRAPFISGKDSMKNDIRSKNRKEQMVAFGVKPTLLISAITKVDTRCIPSNSFSHSGFKIAVIGSLQEHSLAASQYAQHYEVCDTNKSSLEFEASHFWQRYLKIHEAISNKKICDIHDVSEGGLLVALCEMTFGHNIGANIVSEEKWTDAIYFNEYAGRFVVSFDPQFEEELVNLFKDEMKVLGETTQTPQLNLKAQGDIILEADCLNLKSYWRKQWK